jgi:hypothetical protein
MPLNNNIFSNTFTWPLADVKLGSARKLTAEYLKLVWADVKLGCFDDVHVNIYVDVRPRLYLKTRTRFSPVS